MTRKKSKKSATSATGPQSRRALRLHGSIAREIGTLIVSGRYAPGQLLDGEVEASARRKVSRTAYREAMRILAAKGLVHCRPRVGTRVSALEQWHLLDPDVLSWVFSGEPAPRVLDGLFELRSIVEPAAAALAAARRNQQHLDIMRRALDAMSRHGLREEEGRVADMEFHAAILDATDNPFVVSLTKGITAAVDAITAFKLRLVPVCRDPSPDHRRVFDAIAAADPEGARAAMSELIRRASLDTPPKTRSQAGAAPRRRG